MNNCILFLSIINYIFFKQLCLKKHQSKQNITSTYFKIKVPINKLLFDQQASALVKYYILELIIFIRKRPFNFPIKGQLILIMKIRWCQSQIKLQTPQKQQIHCQKLLKF
ncbi:unnamed protein product [Paramecium sonneborni]|uniref:Uncharacterized protein n=1 Tax=Paramecium sonneborni TaxID=65129 RepID=A0A8S1RHF8_9CILI|nr:unnamed protein product [Paramecium sonneborni]